MRLFVIASTFCSIETIWKLNGTQASTIQSKPCSALERRYHSLNMELDLQIYLGSMSRDVHSCSHWLRPRNPPPPFPRIWAHTTRGAIGQTTSSCNPLVATEG
jgi:hypothetical protein